MHIYFLSFILFFSISYTYAGEIKKLEATIDYTQDLPENDLFFAEIVELDGKAVDLKLTLIPEEQVSDHITISLDEVDESEDHQGLSCLGENRRPGDLNSITAGAGLSFRAKGEHHHPTSIFIGNRQNYPFQTLRCQQGEGVGLNGLPTYVSGRFVVSIASIPTAYQITLYPIQIILGAETAK